MRAEFGRLFAIAQRDEQQEERYRKVRDYLAHCPDKSRGATLAKLRAEWELLCSLPDGELSPSMAERRERLGGILAIVRQPVRASVDWEQPRQSIKILGAIEGEQTSEDFAQFRLAFLRRPAPRANTYGVVVGHGNQGARTYYSMANYLANRPDEEGAEDGAQSVTVWASGANPLHTGRGLHRPENEREARHVSPMATFTRRPADYPAPSAPRSIGETTPVAGEVCRKGLPRLAYKGRTTLEEGTTRAVLAALAGRRLRNRKTGKILKGRNAYRYALRLIYGKARARAILASQK